jgi:hypothetical protein
MIKKKKVSSLILIMEGVLECTEICSFPSKMVSSFTHKNSDIPVYGIGSRAQVTMYHLHAHAKSPNTEIPFFDCLSRAVPQISPPSRVLITFLAVMN